MCDTKYQILLVHGTGFRDYKKLNYWGRIPKALEDRNAVIFYSKQDSWSVIEKNVEIIRKNLLQIIDETECEKVNIIAHSKGRLEARYLTSSLGCKDMIASITTISTPHFGSKTMDILWKYFRPVIYCIGIFVNLWYRMLGDKQPDFYHVCEAFTTRYMESFNDNNPDMDNIFYQSFASSMKNPFSDMLMFLPNFIISIFEGENDGLVSIESAKWTNFSGVWRSEGRRGISHGDVVDMRRKNFAKNQSKGSVSDIRCCYIDIASKLKERGL